eukprot:gene2921-5735_t
MASVCSKPGCNFPRWIETRTRVEHKFCGRTHAIEVEGNIEAPHGSCHRCNLQGCSRNVNFNRETGRVHDFCCADHADKAIERGEWNPQGKQKHMKGSKRCKFPGCSEFSFFDESRNLEYDFCGRTHAIEHKIWENSQNIIKVNQQQNLRQPRVPVPIPVAKSIPLRSMTGSTNNASLKTAVGAPPANNIGGVPQGQTTNPVRKTRHSASTPVISSEPKLITLSSSQLNNRSIAGIGNPSVTHFCVVCADDTADTVLHPCGHLCVCYEHGVELKKSATQNKCPLCAEPIDMLIKVKGISSTAAIAAAV